MYEAPINEQAGLLIRANPMRAIPRGRACSRGDVMMFDTPWVSALTATRRPGREDSSKVNVVAVNPTGPLYGILCVALAAIPENCVGPVAIYGEYDALVSGSVLVGASLVAVNAQQHLAPGTAAGQKYVGIVTEARTGAGLTKCIFNGSGGHGVYTG